MPDPMDVSSFKREPVKPLDLLQMLGQYATTAHTLQTMEQQRLLFKAQTATGQVLQKSIGPDGKVSNEQFIVGLANHPDTAPLIHQTLSELAVRDKTNFDAMHTKLTTELATLNGFSAILKGALAHARTERGPNGEPILMLDRKYAVEAAGRVLAVMPHKKNELVAFLGKVGNNPVEIHKRLQAIASITDTAAGAIDRTLGTFQSIQTGDSIVGRQVSPQPGIEPRPVGPPIRMQPTVQDRNAPQEYIDPVTKETKVRPAGTQPMFEGGGGQAPGTGGLPPAPQVPVGGPGAQPGQTMPGGFSSNLGGFVTGAEIGQVSPPQDMSRQGQGIGTGPAGPIDIRPPAQRVAQALPPPRAAAPPPSAGPSAATYAPAGVPLPRARPEDLGAVASPEVLPVQAAPAVAPSAQPSAQPFSRGTDRVTKLSPLVEEELKARGGPIAKKIIEDVTNEGTSSADMKMVIQKVTETFDSLKEGTFTPGAGATLKEFAARVASGLGVPEKTVDRITNLGRAQEYEKLSLQVAVLQLKKFMEGAGRFTNLEFDSFRKANPNWETDVRAVRQVLGFMDKMADIALQKQAAMDAWLSGSRPKGYENAGMDQFSAAWNKTLKDNKILDTVYDDGRKLLQDLRVMRNTRPQIIVRPQPNP